MSPFASAPPVRVAAARLWVFAAGAAAWAALLGGTLHDLQVRRAGPMRDQARRQQEQVVAAEPRRGTILDRMGRELAISTDVHSVYAAPEEVRDSERERAVAGLAAALDLRPSQVRERLAGDGFVLLRKRVSPDVADRVQSLRLAGIHLVAESKRYYPGGSLAAHVLGFAAPGEPRVREGLEKRYDAEIRGTPGALVALRDATGGRFLMEARRRPVRGSDLVVSLDEVVQHVAERELAAAVEATRSRAGTVVVLHTPTGEILALANVPTFNPNRYGAFPAEARRNRAITDYYEPGSTFKLVTAAAALEAGLVRPSEVIDCQMGTIRVAGIPIRDHKPFPLLTFADVIAQSSNVGAAKVGLRLDPRDFHDRIARFGFGSRTGVDLPGEGRGMLRPASRWTATSPAYISFGQEIGATPLQVAAALSAVANRGVHVPPRVALRIQDPDGRGARVPERAPPRRVVSEATADVLVDLLEGVVTSGTGRPAAVPGHRVAGKTGTAQKIVDGAYAPDRHVSSFGGFVPSRRPVLTILVVLDEPRGSLFHGGDVAAPVFRRIAEPVLEYLGVPRDEEAGREVVLAALGGEMDQNRDAAWAAPAATGRLDPARRGRSSSGAAVLRAVAPRPLDPRESGGGAPDGRAVDAPAPAAALVPDLGGAPLRDAVVRLAREGLAAAAEGDGFVVAQSPPAGAAAPPGGVVRLRLARIVEEVPAPEGREADGAEPPARARAGGGPAGPRRAPARAEVRVPRDDGRRGGAAAAHEG
jgi:cell division protein FtsI (penicillin-binding protein 3)